MKMPESNLASNSVGHVNVREMFAAQKLLYVADYSRGTIDVYTYPQDVRIRRLDCCVNPSGLCVDRSGDIWVTDSASKELVEFKHNGTHPLRTLKDSAGFPVACAVDQKTGDLAVANQYGRVLIFRQAHNPPVHVVEPYDFSSSFVAYDGSGTLFIEGPVSKNYHLQMLRVNLGKRRAAIVNIKLKFSHFAPAGLQWDGTDLAVGNAYGITHKQSSVGTIYRLRVSGTHATLDSTVKLISPQYGGLTDFWIEGNEVVGSIERWNVSTTGWVDFWAYPRGGRLLRSLKGSFGEPFGVAVSD